MMNFEQQRDLVSTLLDYEFDRMSSSGKALLINTAIALSVDCDYEIDEFKETYPSMWKEMLVNLPLLKGESNAITK